MVNQYSPIFRNQGRGLLIFLNTLYKILMITESDPARRRKPSYVPTAEKHSLIKLPYEQTAGWPYFDFNMDTSWDVLMSDAKRIDRGFTEMVDTERMFLDLFAEFRRRKVLP